jgi:hypothetical protein
MLKECTTKEFQKKIALATMEGTRKRGKSLTTRRSEAEEELNLTGVKNKQAMVRDYWEWKKIVLEAKVRKDCNA